MKVMHLLAAFAGAVSLAACPAPAPTEETPTEEAAETAAAGTCLASNPREFTAHVNAMPGPNATATLNVSGTVDLPTPAHTAALTEGMADRSATPWQQLVLTVTPPAEGTMAAQVITPAQLTYTGTALSQTYAGVRVMCEGQVLTEVQVTVAQ
ncbi:MAG: hypothetical protein HC869_19295 [Rhodospirillales bacterium]|nr:hypothetical protein [Rhodospirillales bacterium]